MVLVWFCSVTPDNAVCLLRGVIDGLWGRGGGHCVSVDVSCSCAAARLIVSSDCLIPECCCLCLESLYTGCRGLPELSGVGSIVGDGLLSGT